MSINKTARVNRVLCFLYLVSSGKFQTEKIRTGCGSIMTTFTVLTLNIKCYSMASAATIARRIEEIGADVVCLQEDIIDTYPLPSLYYRRVATSVSSDLRATRKQRQKRHSLEDSIYNTIYVRTNRLSDVSGAGMCLSDLQAPFPIERRSCAAVDFSGVRIANVHLSGGAYEDATYAMTMPNIKAHEIEKVLRVVQPCMVVGDLNGERDPKFATKQLVAYRPYAAAKDQQRYLHYHCAAHAPLEKAGLTASCTENAICPTSVHGGVPDWIYYDKQHITQVGQAQRINTLHITDHCAIIAHFRVN